jgi:polyisoprenoid-binding protein YceI
MLHRAAFLPLLFISAVLSSAVLSPIQAAFAGQPLTLKADSALVEFKAVGRPSLLKIPGKSTRLEVKLEREDSGALKGSFEFPLDTLETGIGLRDSHMKEKYLETAKFPTAKLEITDAIVPAAFFNQEAGEQPITVKGNLTLHGVTKPVEVQTRLVREGKGFTAESAFKIMLTDYGISIPKYLGIVIAEDVDVKIRFAAE